MSTLGLRMNELVRACLSPPGCGKSEFCKSLGKEVGRPVVTLDVGSLMGSLVGQSKERTREALRIIDSMAPCVVMIDEIEKAFVGASGGSGDSGVLSRMFGTLSRGKSRFDPAGGIAGGQVHSKWRRKLALYATRKNREKENLTLGMGVLVRSEKAFLNVEHVAIPDHERLANHEYKTCKSEFLSHDCEV